MTTRTYGGYVVVDSHMEKHVPTNRQYRSSEETDFVPKSNSTSARSNQRRDLSTLPTETNSTKRTSNLSQSETIPDKYSRDVKAYIESNSGHKPHKSVHNNDLSRRHSPQSSENDSKTHNNTTPRRRSSKHYENGNADHYNGSSQRHSSRHYADSSTGKTNDLSLRSSSRHYEDATADHSSSTFQRRSSRHYENSIADHSNDSSLRRSSKHYEDNISDHSKDAHQRRSSRNYENSISDHSNEKSQRRHSRHHEDGYTDHSNDSSRSRSSKHRADGVTDRSHSSRRRSLKHYEDDTSYRITDTSRKYPSRDYEQYKENFADPANKYHSPRADHTLGRSGYATLPSSTKLGKTERRDARVHGVSGTDRQDNYVGVLLDGKSDILSESRADHGFRNHEHENYGSLHRSGDNVQLHTKSLQRQPRDRDRMPQKSEQPYQSSAESAERRANHQHPQDMRRSSSQFSAPESIKVDLDEQYISYHSNKQTKLNSTTNNRNDNTDTRQFKKDYTQEHDVYSPYRSSNNDLSDDHKKRKPYRHRQTSVERSSSQNVIEENEIIDTYASNKDEHVTTRRRSSSATRNEGRKRETHNEELYPSHNKQHTSFRSSKDMLEKEAGESLFTLIDPRKSSDVSKLKQKNISEHKHLPAKNSQTNNHSRAKHNGITNDVAGHDFRHTTSKDVANADLNEERKHQHNSLFNDRKATESGQSVIDRLLGNSLTNGSSRDYNQTNTQPTGRSRTADSSNRRSTSAIKKHEETNLSSYKQDISYSRRSSSSRSNDNVGFLSSSSSPRREDSQSKLSVDVSPLTATQEKYHRSREEAKHQKRSQAGTYGNHNVLTADLPKQQSSSAKDVPTYDQHSTDRSRVVESTEEYHTHELRGGRKDITASNKRRTKIQREENPEFEAGFPNADTKNSIILSPGSSSVSIINKSDSPKSSSKGDLIEVSSSASTLKDSCVTSKPSITDSISSLLGRSNKYQQFRSNQSEEPSTPISISDKWRKLTRVILPDKDDMSDNPNERRAPATIFYAAAARFMNTLSSVHNVLPKSAHISTAQPAHDSIASSPVQQDEHAISETQVEEQVISEAKSELNLSPPNTLSIQENIDRVSPSHSVVSLEVPQVVASQRTSIISTAGNLSSHTMRISAYALMTEKTTAPESEIGNHVKTLTMALHSQEISSVTVSELQQLKFSQL